MPERKNPLHFCFVAEKQGATPLIQWLENKGWRQEDCGLVAIPNMRDLYGLYYDASGTAGFSGILRKENANEVALSSVPKHLEPAGLLSFNKDGYTRHCKDYRDYWEWVSVRNEERFKNTIQHGKNYDAKNMMHTFRLLDMAAEILEKGQIIVRRPNRDALLAIRRGDFLYEDLIAQAAQKLEKIEQLYVESPLPDFPDKTAIEALLVSTREAFYRQQP